MSFVFIYICLFACFFLCGYLLYNVVYNTVVCINTIIYFSMERGGGGRWEGNDEKEPQAGGGSDEFFLRW